MSESERAGRCFCGKVRFVATGEPKWVAHCHCESCRRATSAPFTTYAGYHAASVRWSGDAPGEFRSSPGVLRRFCGDCGSPMSFEGDRWPGEIHLFVASFEDPASLEPTSHVHVGEQLPWLHLADGLPRYATTARDGPPLRPAR
jgi:hypothetical protein